MRLTFQKSSILERIRGVSPFQIIVMYELAVTFSFSQLGEMGVAEFIRYVP
jgi:hypothetical protein